MDKIDFAERDRLRRQQELIKRDGQEAIDHKKRELCDNCTRQSKCNLIPTIEGCCYHDAINTEPLPLIEPEDIEWEDLK